MILQVKKICKWHKHFKGRKISTHDDDGGGGGGGGDNDDDEEEEEDRMTFNFEERFFSCPSERDYPCKSSTDCTGSSRRNWNVHWLMPCNYNRRLEVHLSQQTL
jgi:hypothetical protein